MQKYNTKSIFNLMNTIVYLERFILDDSKEKKKKILSSKIFIKNGIFIYKIKNNLCDIKIFEDQKLKLDIKELYSNIAIESYDKLECNNDSFIKNNENFANTKINIKIFDQKINSINFDSDFKNIMNNISCNNNNDIYYLNNNYEKQVNKNREKTRVYSFYDYIHNSGYRACTYNTLSINENININKDTKNIKSNFKIYYNYIEKNNNIIFKNENSIKNFKNQAIFLGYNKSINYYSDKFDLNKIAFLEKNNDIKMNIIPVAHSISGASSNKFLENKQQVDIKKSSLDQYNIIKPKIDYEEKYNFYKFIKKAFQILNPRTEFKECEHIRCLEKILIQASLIHLEYEKIKKYYPDLDINSKQIKNFIINMPPRELKSTIISIIWSAWLLGNAPFLRIIIASSSSRLSKLFVMQTKQLIKTDWFKSIFPEFNFLNSGNNSQIFHSTENGFRMGCSLGENIIGYGADYLIMDDPPRSYENKKIMVSRSKL
jgi:hypothetical protein